LFVSLALAGLADGVLAGAPGDREYFEPAHRLLGIGAGRAELSDDIIARRAGRMIESQTFGILRDPRAAAGAQRILSPKLQGLFNKAASASGLPSSLIAAIAYLESWGDARAQSPSGPRGIMQISAGTARSMGLRIVYGKRYRLRTQTRRVRTRGGKWITKRVRVRVPYTVLVRDDRLIPEKAIPAAAKYLARLDDKFGGLDWAVFAYHCGESCAVAMRSLTEQADGIRPPYTVAKMFFGASPAVNRDLYLAVERQMERDYSPTYWFRVMRARQLLAMYREDPGGFRKLAAEFRSGIEPERRAPHRLAVWLNSNEPAFQSFDRPEREERKSLVRAFDDPDYYGFRLYTAGRGTGAGDTGDREHHLLASPSAVGTLAYIAFETRRLHEAMDVKDERFVPLQVTSLVKPLSSPAAMLVTSGVDTCDEAILHSTGHVFDINYGNLPPGEREAFEFVLNDLGWNGYLGFIHATPNSQTLHIGCSPSSREFFDQVFADAFEKTEARISSRMKNGAEREISSRMADPIAAAAALSTTAAANSIHNLDCSCMRFRVLLAAVDPGGNHAKQFAHPVRPYGKAAVHRSDLECQPPLAKHHAIRLNQADRGIVNMGCLRRHAVQFDHFE
jgi:hypothetical protein